MKPSFIRTAIFLYLIVCWCSMVSCSSKLESPVIIDIQPMEGISTDKVKMIAIQLRKVYPHILIKEPIPFPANSFVSTRNRFRADSIIKYLQETTPKGHVTLALTNKDISTTKGEISDWGVMGLGYRPGRACISSHFRLSKENVDAQFYKVCIHEIGHTQGLEHCPIKSCFMRNAHGGNPTNEEKEFCEKCKKVLIDKGWRLN